MPVKISDYPNVIERCEKLGIGKPQTNCVLPNNFESAASQSDWEYSASETTVRLLLRDESIEVAKLEDDQTKRKLLSRRSLTWYGPVLFFTAAELAQNPHLVSVSLGVIANFLTEQFRGTPGEHEVRLDIVTEKTKTKTTRKFSYAGNVEGLKTLKDAILKEVENDD